MTTANPTFEGVNALPEVESKRHRGRGKRLFAILAFAAALSFLAARMRGQHNSNSSEDSHGV